MLLTRQSAPERPRTAGWTHVGRLGALAVALGVGAAIATSPGIARADDSPSGASEQSARDSDGPSPATTPDAGPASSSGSGTADAETPTAIGDPREASATTADDSDLDLSKSEGSNADEFDASGFEEVRDELDEPADLPGADGAPGGDGVATGDDRQQTVPPPPPVEPANSDSGQVPPSESAGAVAEPAVTGVADVDHFTAEPDLQQTITGYSERSAPGDTENAQILPAVSVDHEVSAPAAPPFAKSLAAVQKSVNTAVQSVVNSVRTCACQFVLRALTAVFSLVPPPPPAAGDPSIPAQSDLMWSLFGWARRQIEQVLALPPVARVVSDFQVLVTKNLQKLAACANPSAGLSAEFERTTLLSGLDSPVDFRFLPGDGNRVVIAEKSGAIKIFDLDDPAAEPVTLIVLPTETQAERGLAGIELDPNFETNGYLYIAYTAARGPSDLRDRLSRVTIINDAVVEGSEVVLVESTLPDGLVHHGGEIRFGPDDMLYWAVGDNSYSNNAQDLSNIHGKILRINPVPGDTIPDGNPVFADHPDADPHIWAYGLRNPFRFTFTPDGELLVGDVGNSTWEELNLVVKGGNYGWPNAEGPCEGCDSIDPIYAYRHTAATALQGAITSVLVYTGDTYPDRYRNKVFIADYTQGWIKELTFDAEYTTLLGERTFDNQAGTAVKLLQGPDGNIYQLNIYPGELSRIAPSDGNRAPTAVLTATPSNGYAPLEVHFSSAGSSDPDPGTTLSYVWDFGDDTTSIDANPVKTYVANGTYTVTLTVSDGAETGQATQTITVGSTAPRIDTMSPTDGTLYNASDVISLSATAFDDEDGALPDEAYEWTVVFHHLEHVHPFEESIIGSTATVTIPRDPHNEETTWYRVTLTVTDSSGLSTSRTVDIKPRLVNLTFDTSDPEAKYTIDGIPRTGTYTERGVVGVERLLAAPSPQVVSDGTLVFVGWQDENGVLLEEGAIVTPDTDATYTAVFTKVATVI